MPPRLRRYFHHPLHALVAEVADEHRLRPGGDRRVREVTPRCLTPAQLTEAIVGAWGDPLVASAEDETVGQVDDHSLRILSSAREVAALDLRALVLCREEREVESDELDGMSLGIEDCMMQACPGREILKLLFALRVGLINRGDPSRVWPLKGRRNADQLACLIEKSRGCPCGICRALSRLAWNVRTPLITRVLIFATVSRIYAKSSALMLRGPSSEERSEKMPSALLSHSSRRSAAKRSANLSTRPTATGRGSHQTETRVTPIHMPASTERNVIPPSGVA